MDNDHVGSKINTHVETLIFCQSYQSFFNFNVAMCITYHQSLRLSSDTSKPPWKVAHFVGAGLRVKQLEDEVG